jgi:hypothetical protein
LGVWTPGSRGGKIGTLYMGFLEKWGLRFCSLGASEVKVETWRMGPRVLNPGW